MADKTTLKGQCPHCSEEFVLVVYTEDFIKWRNGALVQDAFLYLSADERESLISGTCKSCWSDITQEEWFV
jgi:hypothetical protein